ncbi:MAG TPA: hypothetical protein VJ936_09345 [Desulfobacteraceae bacterium]|nr:hypothetical protein [Desulfobacteraceae bacterium]
MVKILKKQYLTLLLPPVLGFILAGGAKALDMEPAGLFKSPGFLPPFLFVLSAVTAIAAPVLARTLFAHRMRNEKRVAPDRFLAFEKRLLAMVLITPWFALAAYGLDFQRFYSTGIVLMAFYAVYYYYPSEKRIRFDQKIFRVTDR